MPRLFLIQKVRNNGRDAAHCLLSATPLLPGGLLAGTHSHTVHTVHKIQPQYWTDPLKRCTAIT